MYGESLATCPWSISTDWLRNEDLPVGAEAVGKLLLLAAVRAPFAVLALCSAKRNAAPVSGESMLANSARAASMVCGPSEGPPRGGEDVQDETARFSVNALCAAVQKAGLADGGGAGDVVNGGYQSRQEGKDCNGELHFEENEQVFEKKSSELWIVLAGNVKTGEMSDDG